MKVRLGFVSNSSSASFVISLLEVTQDQLKKIKAYADDPEPNERGYNDGGWRISTNRVYVQGHTMMDNGAMSAFLKKIGVPEDAVAWDLS